MTTTVNDYLRRAGDHLQSRLPEDDTHIAMMMVGMRDILNIRLPELGLPKLDTNKAPLDEIERLLTKGGTAQQVKALQDCQRWLQQDVPTIEGWASNPSFPRLVIRGLGRAAMKRAALHTVSSSQRSSRKPTRSAITHSDRVAQVLRALENGAALYLAFERGRAIWQLSTGPFITPKVADDVTHNRNVIAVGDCLFGDAASQTYRWTDQ